MPPCFWTLRSFLELRCPSQLRLNGGGCNQPLGALVSCPPESHKTCAKVKRSCPLMASRSGGHEYEVGRPPEITAIRAALCDCPTDLLTPQPALFHSQTRAVLS